MKITYLVLIGTVLLADLSVKAQIQDFRYTHNSTPVAVIRQALTEQNRSDYFFYDIELEETYPEAQLLVAGSNYQYFRNCHDYAFGPYDSCMCQWPGPQTEAWYMNDPRPNWAGSAGLARYVNSLVNDPLGEPRPDYLFYTSDLEAIPFLFYDVFGDIIYLPVCDLQLPSSGEVPSHAAVLVDWVYSDIPDLSYGIFVSKWGNQGLFMHRWGEGLCRPDYCDTSQLTIFAPEPGWLPPYFVWHTPW